MALPHASDRHPGVTELVPAGSWAPSCGDCAILQPLRGPIEAAR